MLQVFLCAVLELKGERNVKCEGIFTGSRVDLLLRQVTVTHESRNRVRSIFAPAAKTRSSV